MPPATIHSTLEIPELAACIASFLAPADVTNAMATCRAWSAMLQPFFWANFCPKDKLPEMSVLAQNLHHIRTIDLKHQLTRAIDLEALLETLAQGLLNSADPTTAPCTNLKRLAIAFECYDVELDNPSLWLLWTLVYHNRNNLTHLSIQLDGIDDVALTPAVVVLSAMIQLQHLTVRTSYQSEAWFMAMLLVCLSLPRLSELFCHFFLEAGKLSTSGEAERDYEDWHFDRLGNPIKELKAILDSAIAARSSANGFIDVKIKALRFPDPEEDDIDLIRLVLPVLRSDLVEIETLEVPKLLDSRPEEFYEKMVRENCPALKHLIFPPYDDFTQIPDHFIQAATGLKTARGFRLYDQIGYSSPRVIYGLAKHHSKTLEEVELMICRMVKSRAQQTLFTSCRQLKRFWMVPDGMSEGEHGIEFRHIITGAWSCLEMRELSLTLNRFIDVKATLEAMRRDSSNKAAGDGDVEMDEAYRSGDKEQKRRATAWAAKQVFAQIGQLTALGHLALGTDEGPHGEDEEVLESKWDLTLSKGWLDQLAGLRNLSHLHMRTDHWSYMGQAQVEFMDAEWPWLDCVTFDECSISKKQFREEISRPHWQWLQQKRPSLRLSVIHMYTGTG
ncbi:hypothetical protein BGZ67_002837 [Mortierella alpina]|nr:hypothetical protein BGZ67_002837 [Mortierella alpina]